MANYKQSTVSGESWTRCFKIEINNSLPAGEFSIPPTVYFYEEKVLSVEGQNITISRDVCSKVFNPIDGQIILIDAEGAPTGKTMSHLELYSILNSLYIQIALERDAVQQV